MKENSKAEAAYEKALQLDPNCQVGAENSVSHIVTL